MVQEAPTNRDVRGTSKRAVSKHLRLKVVRTSGTVERHLIGDGCSGKPGGTG